MHLIKQPFRKPAFFVIFLLLHTMILRAQDNLTRFRNNVFITNWSVCGPFQNGNGKNIDTDFLINAGGESQIELKPGLKHPSKAVESGQVGWTYAIADKSGKLDIKKHLSPNQKNIAYCAAWIECDNITPAILKLGSNDRLKVWLNGKLVHVFSRPRAGGPDTDQLPVELQKGKNLLLAKVDNEGGNWWLYARFAKLESVDGSIFMTRPLIGTVPKRLKDGRIADIFNIMLYNTSDIPSGPVVLKVKAGKNRKEAKVDLDFIGSKEYQWITLESPVNISKDESSLRADLLVSSDKGSRSFKLKSKREGVLDGKVYFIQGFHVDPVWRDSQSGYQALTFSNFTQHLNAVQADTSFGLFVSEIPYLKPYYDEFPQARALIRKYVKEGRIETGGSYNQPNETTISGEAFIRNILYGRLFHENVLGDYPRVYAPWDVFGHIIQLPQILAKSEFIGTTWERGNYRSPFVRVPDIPDLYRSMSPDGSTILNRKVTYSYNGPQTGQYYDVDLQTKKLIYTHLVQQREQIPGLKSDIIINATDEKAPTTWIVGNSNEFKYYIPEVSVQADGAEQYFRNVQNQLDKNEVDIPIVTRDVSQYNEGCALSRFDLKLGNRLVENTLISAEKFATLANLLGHSYPAKSLDKAWRQVLFGQHHDGMTGCGADVPYLDLVEAYHEALELGWNALHQSLRAVSGKVITNSMPGVPLIVYNPLNWKRTDVVKTRVELEEGWDGFRIIDQDEMEINYVLENRMEKNGKIYMAEISFVAPDVPSVGYKTFWLIPAKEKPKNSLLKKSENHIIENAFYRLTLDENAGGGISSLIEKSSGREFIKSETGHPGNELILLKEGGGFEPAWRFLTTGKKSFSHNKKCEIEIFENPVYKKIVITGEMDRMEKRIQEIFLYNNLKRIDFRTSLVAYEGLNGKNIIENDERERSNDRDLYCIGFPANIKGGVPVLEDRFATKTYYPGKEYLSYYSTDTEWTSHHSMNSCNQWIDYSYSVKVNFGKDKSIALGPAEVLTTRSEGMRKTGYRLVEALAKKGVTATPSFDDVIRDYDIQYRRFSFSLGVKAENSYNNKLISRLNKEQQKDINRQLKENGFACFFTYDTQIDGGWFDLPVLAIIGRDEHSLTEAVEKIIEDLNQNAELNFPSSVCYAELKDKVPDYGLAILNRGNIAVSTEPDGTMVLALMHTVPWQSPLLNWTHDFPERKTHVFEYALVPHKGNWRQAKLVRSGYEFNNPLIAIQSDAHDGTYPAVHSFFSTEDENIVITALKAETNGNAAFKAKTATDVSNGIILRLYETGGQEKEIAIRSDFVIKKAEKVNLMERKPERVTFTKDLIKTNIGPNAIETFSLSLEGSGKLTNKPAEKGISVYAPYWQHNDGAAPTGYLPVSVKILGKLKSFGVSKFPENVQQIKVAVVNDFTDAPVNGKLRIETPPGLRAVPAEIDYQVDANSESFYPVAIIPKSTTSEPGFIIATIEHGGTSIYDVMEYNMPEKRFGHNFSKNQEVAGLSWDIHENDGEIEMIISNPFTQSVKGSIAIIGPVETWGLEEVNPACLTDVSPWKQVFEVPALGTKKLIFKVHSDNGEELKENEIWLVAKLAYFGYVDYKPVMGELVIQGE